MSRTESLVKSACQALAKVLVFPLACIALFGRSAEGFAVGGQLLCVVPGLLGSFLRVAFYRFTLEACHPEVHIAFGSYFAHPQASVGQGVGIGAYCVLGKVKLGTGTLVASGVQILSGSQQHVRAPDGSLSDDGRVFREITVGPRCWIGAAATVMANLGERVTVAAGSVVTKDFPDGVVVAGNPARIVRPAIEEAITG